MILPAGVDVETVVEPEGKGKAPRTRAKVVEEAPAIAGDLAPDAVAETRAAKPAKPAKAAKKAGKTPEQKFSTKTAAPKPSKAQAKAPVRRSAPRGKG